MTDKRAIELFEGKMPQPALIAVTVVGLGVTGRKAYVRMPDGNHVWIETTDLEEAS